MILFAPALSLLFSLCVRYETVTQEGTIKALNVRGFTARDAIVHEIVYPGGTTKHLRDLWRRCCHQTFDTGRRILELFGGNEREMFEGKHGQICLTA